MPRYRQSERRWIQAALVAGAYLVCVALLFMLQLGAGLDLPVPVAMSAPPLVYAALAMLLLRRDSFVRRLAWLGGACLVHLVLGVLAATELAWAGGLSFAAALAQVFVLFPPAPALTLLATPVALAAFGLTASRPTPRAEPAPPRQVPATRQKPMPTPARGVRDAAPPMARVMSAAGATAAPTPTRPTVPAPAAVPTAAVAAPAPPAPVIAAPAIPVAPAPPVIAAPVPAVVAAPAAPGGGRAAKPVRSGDDGMVRVPFARISAQLPAEAFVLPFERLSESLREPHVVLVSRRVVLSQMRDGAVAITWGHIASQFPDLALGMSDDEFRQKYSDLRLVLSIEELASQLPAGTMSSAPAQPEWTKEPPVSPASVVAPSDPPAPVPPRPAPVQPALAPPRAELVGRAMLGRIVACFRGVGTFEAGAERLAGGTVVALVEPGLPRDAAAACADQLLRFAAGAGDLLTVRTERAVVIVAAAALPIVVAAEQPGAPVALLALRARAAADADGLPSVQATPRRTLEPAAVDARVTQAARAVRSFGTVEATVFAEGAARVYVFSAGSGDDKAVAEEALGLAEAFRDGGPLGRMRSVVSRRGDVQTVVRPLAGAAGVLAITGPVARPGRLLGDADRAAAVLETR